MQAISFNVKLLVQKTPLWVQVATVMKLKVPPDYKHVVMPARNRLPLLPKQPEPLNSHFPFPKMQKKLYLMRGPEPVHNDIIYGEFAIQALEGGRLRFAHLESIRMQVIRKMNEKTTFAHYRVPPPWQSVTKKPLGHRMGSGKGSIDRWEVPIKPDRIIIEFGGQVEFKEVQRLMETIRGFLPFKARVITRQDLKEEKQRAEELKDKNMNPFSYRKCAMDNMLGMKHKLSPYTIEFDGKYR
ncbi:39S ribosomal protein L16, mitochondrial-like [Dreissena polymorpha]|uniref:Large ribosomal subunit protein uL16m n=1 Tax=Dreissena polymorpha TaxID=45954 RepID=A0A9D4N8X9_DREPO|nr:39S ribosomal protein L16, mitochondrial-like [Dreissena polymorpha]KAH3890241.1 hypothetical protein DPMN_014314 [Dreissena polymorpha]